MIVTMMLLAMAAQTPEEADFQAYERYIAGCQADFERGMVAMDQFVKTGKYIGDAKPAFAETLPESERRLARAACLGWLRGAAYMNEKRGPKISIRR